MRWEQVGREAHIDEMIAFPSSIVVAYPYSADRRKGRWVGPSKRKAAALLVHCVQVQASPVTAYSPKLLRSVIPIFSI